MKKNSQQSRSGWGGKRKGAGAPLGNTNAVKHGERSRRAFFPFEGEDALSPLVRNRARNLMLAERYGLLLATNPTPGTEEWREMTLINGLMGLHADRIARLELRLARSISMQARRDLRRVKKSGAC
ncbi:TPA: hypothetical protein RFT19_004208 [Klebsiella pneumoniae subsp. pneumoniae]|uniref:hypothetical protein n=1 Tax=Klebsiella quasipneumoniae TaxID=1463165 RepID=UPI002274598D|nr:hypothetical protein [Klebsiella quasipneumoniae]HBQ6876899.1 hypothetical protein [Klebsiella pneumoniae]HDS2298580.1 hypothetical protein [Klebsiella pneumoniae subsp. pneumoniae]HCF8799928.1 hypothetical protein [Klebsiella pneumoniae]HCF8903381.1 hypothetical protein [Klebsiella pneumoniae]HDS6835368.1 hypothetical protein [Klebsiella pneumoniae subsp. pneumoniae]